MENQKKNENFLVNLSLNVIIPSIILSKYSGDQHLGQVMGLIIAISFPISYGLWDLAKSKKFNFFSALGLFSVLMTGGIGLLNLDRSWMVAKETGIPLIMGIVVFVSNYLKKPLLVIFCEQIMDLRKVEDAFKEKNLPNLLQKKLLQYSNYLGSTFFVSALLNYILAIQILQGEPGTEEFNKSLGKMTALSFPVITIPIMIMVGLIFFALFKMIKKHTNLDTESLLKQI